MKPIQDFRIDSVPMHCIAAAATQSEGYEETRLIFAENYPTWGDYTMIEGSHCSCYGFDDTQWSAITYTSDELLVLARGWVGQNYGPEPMIAPLILHLIGK